MGTESFSNLKDLINTASSNGRQIASLTVTIKGGRVEATGHIKLPRTEQEWKRAEKVIMRTAKRTGLDAVTAVMEPVYQLETRDGNDGQLIPEQ